MTGFIILSFAGFIVTVIMNMLLHIVRIIRIMIFAIEDLQSILSMHVVIDIAL